MADQPSPTSLQPLLSEAEQREAARQAERWATAQRIAAERQDLDVWLGRIDSVALHEAARRAGGSYNVGFGMHPPMLGGEGLDRLDLVVTAQSLGLLRMNTSRPDRRS